MNFYGLFYIVVYEAIKINHCTPSYHLNSVLHFWFCHKLTFFGTHYYKTLLKKINEHFENIRSQ